MCVTGFSDGKFGDLLCLLANCPIITRGDARSVSIKHVKTVNCRKKSTVFFIQFSSTQ
jgi:hypothetical protein